MKNYKPINILNKNTKTGCSINFPIPGHCRPTKICYKHCYGKTGPMIFKRSKIKFDYISRYLKRKNISQLIDECRKKKAVRISGCGDLLSEHVPNIIKLAKECHDTMFWGMTRKIEIARAINNKLSNLKLLLSLDSSSPKSDWKYKGKMCYGPIMEGEKVPEDNRIITVFPYHAHGKIVGNIKRTKKDCPAVRHDVSGCLECGKCWNWKNA